MPVLKKASPRQVIKKASPAKRVIAKKPVLPKRPALNELVSVDFTKNDKGFQLAIQAKQPLKYRFITNTNENKITYTFEKTRVPKNLKRAYDSKEFGSPVALYSLSQLGKKNNLTTRLVIKMRELMIPQVIASGSGVILQFPEKSKAVAQRSIAMILPDTSLGEDAFGGGKDYKGEPIDKLELKNTDVREALRLVLRSSGYNVVVSEEVKGTIGSLSLNNTPWDQAFHLILKMKKLGYVLQGNVVRVSSVETIKTEREEAEKQVEIEPLRTVLIPISYAKAQTLSQRAAPFLSKRGKVDIDDRSNTIIVRDVDGVITKLQKLFKVLDTQPPSISISAKFVELTKTFARTLGLGQITMSGRTAGIDFGAPSSAGGTGNGFLGNSTGGTINLTASRFASLNASLTLGESESKVKVLANPTITVQQGEKGNITQGNQQTLCVPAPMGGVPICSTQIANLTLDVTPIVANDGSISLDTNLLNEIPVFAPPAQLSKDTRQVKTQIILQNGDTAVLGGIFKGSETNTDSGTPFLRSLPLIGYLFSTKVDQTQKSEILIFITARILNPDSAFKQNI
ncbi:AMIN domain-containing protein [bacterium]|nr:AMIN domain-containing protein [bacterium]